MLIDELILRLKSIREELDFNCDVRILDVEAASMADIKKVIDGVLIEKFERFDAPIETSKPKPTWVRRALIVPIRTVKDKS